MQHAAGFCWDERPRCPRGHRVRGVVLPTDGVVECRHRIGRDSPCGVRFYAVLVHVGPVPVTRGQGERLWFVTEASAGALAVLEREPMHTLEKLALLGCVVPGVATDDLTPEGPIDTDRRSA